MPQGNWHILHISYLLIDPLAYWHISILSHWYINFMAIIDIIILAAFGLGAIIGFMKGFVKQLASLLGLIVGLLAAKALYASLAVKLCPMLTDSMTVAQVLAFVFIWLAVPLLFSLGASLLTRAMEAVSLGWLNHWLGAGLGALKYLLLTSLLIGVIEFIDGDNTLISKTKKKESVLYYPMEEFAGIFFPAAKAVTEQIVNGDFD
jgi:membrane protein required for colicin V production